MTPRPYLSLIACSRNDEHGGDAMGRMRTSLACTFEQLERHGIDAEYVMVDWNPPGDRPPLVDAVAWPRDLHHTTIRIIEVPGEIHRRHKLRDQWGLFTPLAYNTGVRRARGDFVVLSMIDHLYPDALMAFLARRSLRTDCAYRMPRVNVDAGVVDVDGVDAQLAWCKDHELDRSQPRDEPLHPDLPALFTDACGDFQLMARDVWHRLRGYRERDLMPQHVDSMIHYAAHAIGVREQVLEDACVYHIDHSAGWTDRLARGNELGSLRLGRHYVPPPATRVDRLLSRVCRWLRLETPPRTDAQLWPYYRRVLVDLGLGRRAHDWNGDEWGLGTETLDEHVVNRATWDVSPS